MSTDTTKHDRRASLDGESVHRDTESCINIGVCVLRMIKILETKHLYILGWRFPLDILGNRKWYMYKLKSTHFVKIEVLVTKTTTTTTTTTT